MSETQDLNRQIAEALGYSVRYAPDSGYSLIAPFGAEYGAGDCSREEGLQAYYASGSEAETWQLAPDYEHSLDAVLAALNDSAARLCIHFDDGRVALQDTSKDWQSESYFDDAPYRAAAQLLLEWALLPDEPTP